MPLGSGHIKKSVQNLVDEFYPTSKINAWPYPSVVNNGHYIFITGSPALTREESFQPEHVKQKQMPTSLNELQAKDLKPCA